MAKRSGLARRTVAAVAAIIVMVVAWAPIVGAEVVPGGPAPGTQANPPTATVRLVGTSSGLGVNGFKTTLTPAERLNGYPDSATVPQPGWSAHPVGFAGLIRMQVTSGPGAGAEFLSYCIDLFTNTNVGINYKPGEWTEANVPNVGYVAQLLQSYFPKTDEPLDVTDSNAKAAAVQAAIWYFSDGYVVSSSSAPTLFATVSGIVANVISKGPLTAPPAPSVTITGPSFGTVNTIVGPFDVHLGGAKAVGTVPAGVEAFSDASGTVRLPTTFFPTEGQQIWLRSATAGIKNPALTVRATVTQPGGVVYLYVPQPGGPAAAQTIIQAGPLVAATDVDLRVAFLDIGSFTITKSISGEGAGQQGPITITISCSAPNSSVPAFNIPGRTPGGTVTTVVTGITVPAHCILTETASGDTEEVDVFAEPTAAASRAAAPRAAVAPRRVALRATQEISVCPATQQLAAPVGGELQSSPGANFENHIETTTTTSSTSSTDSTTTTSSSSSSTDSTTTSTSSTSSTDSTTSTTATTTSTTVSTTTPTTPTTGATTTGATTTAATTTGATTTAAALVPTTAVDECEFAGDTTTPTTAATTGPETLPATGSSGSGPLAVGLIGLVAGLSLVALASRRRFFE